MRPNETSECVGFLEAAYTCNGGYNLSHYCDEDVDTMVVDAAKMSDEQDRWELYRDVSSKLHEGEVSGFPVRSRQLVAVRDAVENLRIHPLDPLDDEGLALQ